MSVKTTRKKRRSLVRLLASCVPNFLWKYIFPVPPRMCISSSLIQKMSNLKQNNFQSDDSNTSFCSFKQNFHNRNPRLIFNSTPKRVIDVEDNKIKALQEELEEIKKIVAKLMERQSEQCSGYGTFSSPSDQLQKSSVSPSGPSLPPLPPPPPPPLPNFSLLPANSPIKIEKKKILTQQSNFLCGKELLKELKKVQLKKVEKSPGGGPVKKPVKVINDAGDILAAALKKRFGYVQNSPESSLESDSVDAENSFGSGTINSYNVQESTKIIVS